LKKATIKLANGKKFNIITNDAGGNNIYIQRILLNGKSYEKNFITYNDIISGGTLEFYMGSTPNKKMTEYTKPPFIAN
jgi:putative alpha-1,2-mannosidase